jgi:hypothetical protein
MKPKGRVLVLLCGLLVSLMLAASAQADIVTSEGRTAEAHLAGTHGYHLKISADSGFFFVTATKGRASVSYLLTRTKFEGERLDARLPGVGRIALRFHERERGHEARPAYCHGPAPVVRRGVFTGWVRIRGERDYTLAESRHVRGKIVHSFASKCRLPFRERRGSSTFKRLEAQATRGRGLLTFSAIEFPLTGLKHLLFLQGSFAHQRGPMFISNSISAPTEKAAAMTVDTPPRSATIDPPQPFTGTATFQQKSAKDFSWTGDLAAELPGIGEVAFAGPGFESSLCVGRRCRGELDESGTSIAIITSTAAAPTPSPWRWPGSPR